MTRRNPNRRILIVGEGKQTEYNYFVELRNQQSELLRKMEISLKVCRGKGGGASTIVRHAIAERKNFQPDSKLGDRVFVLMDTEGVNRSHELADAEKLARKYQIEIVYSSPAFEYWLLCHFEHVSRSPLMDSDEVVRLLNLAWRTVS